ncbi:MULTISPECIES: hypothetical protein [unclassified Streptomyces]|uniref:hypothetical protein n=1 Tax=unclassified Streptomyces TaxID=2593676 RepID=UPI002E1559A0|nr:MULTISPECIES: hypothetical protein [unclassified Streptomyces]WSR23646.1 hypothetical protein OG573_34215 [Streptomyces sp. NBC_01205]
MSRTSRTSSSTSNLTPDGGALLLVVENTGPTVARNVRISCDPPLESGWAPRAINRGAALYARDGSAPDRLF